MQLHVITDGKKTEEELVGILSGIHPYVDLIHIREKHCTARELMCLVEKLLEQGVPPRKLLINDRVDIAHVLNVSGVQLAYHSIGVSHIRRCYPAFRVGCSVHSFEEAMLAEKEGADFVLYGHVYPTKSKRDLPPKGLTELKRMIKTLAIPVVGIGGITLENVSELSACGIGGVAVMSGIMDAENCIEAVKAYKSNLLVEGRSSIEHEV